MRRRLSVRLVIAAVTVLVAQVFTLGAPAHADHNEDQHSRGARLVYNLPNTTNATNSDLAFWGNRAYAGNYDGFRIFDISRPSRPRLLTDFSCPGAQVDTAVWENKLLFTAVDRTMTSPQCGATPTTDPADTTGWEGVRIFDVRNPRAPVELPGVYTDCGAHTITLYPKSRHEVLLYVQSYPLVPGPTCGPVNGPANGNSALHEKISIISVPTRHPERARVIAEPRVLYPGDPDNRFDPDEHGLVGLNDFTACHDVGIHVRRRLAAAACGEQIQLWRIGRDGIPDTEHPVWVFDDKTDSDGPGGGDVGRDFWHTARFTWDGRYIQADDEAFGDGCPVVTLGNEDTGRTHFLDARTGQRQSFFTLPRTEPGVPDAYCSVHQGNFVPTRDGRYLSVSAWYQGGMNVIDFTDPRRPREIAYYDIAGMAHEGSDNWSAYWYEGPRVSNGSLTIYGTDGHASEHQRGFEVFEVRLRGVDDRDVRYMNPQTVG